MDTFLFELSWIGWTFCMLTQILIICVFCGNSNSKNLIDTKNFNDINKLIIEKMN